MSDIDLVIKSEKHYLLFVGLLLLLVTLPWLSLTQFYTRGEAREALVAQSMVKTGNYVLPRGYGGDVPSKPPVLHWAIAFASKITGGVNEFSARLPSLVATLFLTIFLASIVFREDNRAYRIAPFILMTSFEWIRASVSCRVDMLHAASLAGGLLCFFLWKEAKRSICLAFTILLFIGAVLSKGPVGIVIPSLVIVIYQYSKAESFYSIFTDLIKIFVPVLIFSSIWYFLAYQQGDQQFLDKVWYENGKRFLGSMEDSPHKHSIFYLFGVLLLGIMPWSLFLLGFLPFRRGIEFKKLYKTNFYKFSLISSFVVFAFYAIPSSKRGVYLLAAYPFIALCLSPILSFIFKEIPRLANNLKNGLCIFTGLIALASLWLFYYPQLELSIWQGVFPIALFCYSFFLFRKKEVVFIMQAMLFLIAIAFINGFALPAAAKLNLEREIATALPNYLIDNEPLYSFRQEFYAVSFYSDTFIKRYEPSSPSALVLLKRGELSALKGEIQILKEWTQAPFKPSKDNILLIRMIKKQNG